MYCTCFVSCRSVVELGRWHEDMPCMRMVRVVTVPEGFATHETLSQQCTHPHPCVQGHGKTSHKAPAPCDGIFSNLAENGIWAHAACFYISNQDLALNCVATAGPQPRGGPPAAHVVPRHDTPRLVVLPQPARPLPAVRVWRAAAPDAQQLPLDRPPGRCREHAIAATSRHGKLYRLGRPHAAFQGDATTGGICGSVLRHWPDYVKTRRASTSVLLCTPVGPLLIWKSSACHGVRLTVYEMHTVRFFQADLTPWAVKRAAGEL